MSKVKSKDIKKEKRDNLLIQCSRCGRSHRVFTLKKKGWLCPNTGERVRIVKT